MNIRAGSKILLCSANMPVEKPVVFASGNVGDCLGVGQLRLTLLNCVVSIVGVLHKKENPIHISLETTLT